jgi:dolichol-phosphate mannosyltransferase
LVPFDIIFINSGGGSVEVVVVVPAYNERRNVHALVPRLAVTLKRSKVGFRILVVDDGSEDGTAHEVRRLAKRYPVELIERGHKAGLGSAYACGFRKALSHRPQAVVQMDADLSHEPEAVPRLLDAVAAGYDVAIGSRRVEGGKSIEWSGHRKMISFVANVLAKHVAGVRTNDATSGFRAYKASALRRILSHVKANGYDFQIEMTWLAERMGMGIAEVPITFRRRTSGKSKLGTADMLAFLATSIRLSIRGD